MIYIILGIVYYILSSVIFLKLIERECIFLPSNFDIAICLVPIIRVIYYIWVKFI